MGSGFVTLREDASEKTDSIQEDSFPTNTDSISNQTNKRDDIIAKEENEANNKLTDSQIDFKKIFKFGKFKFTFKKGKVEKINADEPVENEQNKNGTGPSENFCDTVNVNPVSTNKQHAKEIKNERKGVNAGAESPEAHNKEAAGKMSKLTEHREEATLDKGFKEDVPKIPKPEEPMSPIKRFFSQGILASLKKKKKEEDRLKQNEEIKCLDKMVEKDCTKEDTTCTCLDVSNGKCNEYKDMQLYKQEDHKHAAEGDVMNFLEQDKVEASPFKRLFRKLSTKRQSETKAGDSNSLEPRENISENPQLSTELNKSQKEQETKVIETQPANEMMGMSYEEFKRKSDMTVSWENLICVRSAKPRARKTSDSEDETQDKEDVPRRTPKSPLESSTDGDHLTSSNEQGGIPTEEDSGSTWKSFKKLVTPKRKSRMDESGSIEQMQSDTEITKDEASCSLRKLISGRKKIKPDGQQDNISSEGSRDTGTDIEDDDTPGVIPLSEYEIVEPEVLNVITDETAESKKDKEMQPIIEEDKPNQKEPLYNVTPLCFDAQPSGFPILAEYMEELTELLSNHQQLSDIPEEGIIEETPISFVEWITQDDTLADDIADMTADAVTAPEHASDHSEDETTEMVSAVSQLSESPKTSGNVTPVSPIYDIRESDKIFQEVVESIIMVPSVLSINTNNKVPEALAVSVSQFIVESTTSTETKVLVTHKKEEATSICIGIVAQEIGGAEVVFPLPLVEGISEINHAVPTEFVSEDLAEDSQAARMANDNVYKAKIEEIKSMLQEVLLLHEQSTGLAETARKSKQQIAMFENIQEEVSPVVQMEDVEDDSTESFKAIHEFTPVLAAVHGGTQLFEEQIITLNINRPETENALPPALEEPVYEQLAQNIKIPVEVEKEYITPGVESIAAGITEPTLVAVAGSEAHNIVESVSDNSLNVVSKIKEDIVQFTEVPKPVMHSAEPDPAINQVSELVKDITGSLVSDVKCSETTVPFHKPIPILDSTKKEMDLQNLVQMENDPLPLFVDSDTITVEVNSTEIQTEEQNAETVVALGSTLNVPDVLNIGEEETKQKIESTSAEIIEEIVNEKIVYNFEAENLSEIMDKPTKKGEDKENELNTLARESILPVATAYEVNAIKEPEDMSKVMLDIENEQAERDTIFEHDCERKQTASEDTYMLTFKTEQETKKALAISEQSRVDEEMAEKRIQPPATDNLKPVSQSVLFKLFADAQTIALISESREDDLAETEVDKRCVDAESDKHLVDKHEHNKTAKPEVYPEFITKQETLETMKPFIEVEPRIDPDEPRSEVLPLKPEQNQTTESSHELYKDSNNQENEAMDKMTKTIPTVTLKCVGKTEVENNLSDQPVATPQCSNGINKVSSLEEVKRPCLDNQYVMSDTRLAKKQEDKTAQPEVTTEIITKHQEAVETFLKVEPRLLPLKLSESHEPYEENNQVASTAKITETVSSVIHKEEPEVEWKISVQPVETGQCFKDEDGVPGSIIEHITEIAHITEILPKDNVESSEGLVILDTEGSEHVTEVIKANTNQVSAEVLSEHEAKMKAGSEQNIPSLDVTEPEVVSEINIANEAVPKANIEITTALKLKVKAAMIISEGQTLAASEQVAESPIVTKDKAEPVVLKQVIKELNTETQEVTESKPDITAISEVQAETPVVSSLVREVEEETLVVTSVEKSVNIKALALTSVINKVQSDLTPVSEPKAFTGTVLRENPIVFSEIQTTTGYLVQTAALSPIAKEVSEILGEVTGPTLETLLVTEAISHTSAVPALESNHQTIESLAIRKETLVRTCVERNVKAQGSVVTSVKEDMDVLQSSVEQTATDIPSIPKPIDGQVIQEPQLSMVAQEIKETKLFVKKTTDTVDANVLNVTAAKETRVEVPGLTEQIIKRAVLASLVSEFEDTVVKEDMGPSKFTLIAEEPTVVSCIKLPTASEAPVVQTPTLTPADLQKLTEVETPAINSEVKEVDMSFTGPDVIEGHCDAQTAVNIEGKQALLPEIEVNATQIIEKVTQDVENTTKKDSESPEERNGRIKEVSVPMIKIVHSQPGADDVWEDAVDDISDDQCPSTKASGDLQDPTMCHSDK